MEERIEYLMSEIKLNDNSFTEKPFLGGILGRIRYSPKKLRKIWLDGIRYGIELGLNKSSLSGQVIELNENLQSPQEKAFYDEYIKLARKYNCAIQYHPVVGMKVVHVDYGFNRVLEERRQNDFHNAND